ncbi:MAG: triose-phosphate isomerase [Candidatus Dasytiphilus stammeri]
MRYPLVIGNWKLNGNNQMVRNYIATLRSQLKNIKFCRVIIAPPIMYVCQAHQEIRGSSIVLAAQNIDVHLTGAYTGDISAEMIKDIGAQYIIVGHSERRIYYHENDELIAKKISILKKLGLIPVLCIGENQGENENGKTMEVCIRQLNAIIERQGVNAFQNVVIAYEPLWSIGTGFGASPLQVQFIHKIIREHIAKNSEAIADSLVIQYGGSVNTTNAAEYFNQPDIDGLLVGESSLDPLKFAQIVQTVENIYRINNFSALSKE